jgi:type II secretory pathway pseudopilin PulG
MLVPGVNVLVYLYLLAVEGTAGANYYGLPARPATQLKTVLMVLIPLLVMSLIGLLTQVVVPSYHSYQAIRNSREAQNNVIVTATNPIQSAQISPATASAVAASTTQPENLRTEAVVITGEQLGNGVASTPQPTAPANVNPATTTNQVSDMLANTPSRTNQMPEAPTDAANSNTSNQGSNERAQTGSNPTTNAPNSSQGVVSYEDFVKASEQQIFIDRR